jgi:hypothetical protein
MIDDLSHVVRFLIRIIILGVACVFAYQSFDSFRSAATGTEPKASAPEKDPQSIKARLSGATWGIMSLGLSLALVWFALFGVPGTVRIRTPAEGN